MKSYSLPNIYIQIVLVSHIRGVEAELLAAWLELEYRTPRVARVQCGFIFQSEAPLWTQPYQQYESLQDL